jgi:predicted TIM-barrel fold metal-dependent hydrolase
MTTTTRTPVIDGDGHIVEPVGLWDQYLEKRYREAAYSALYAHDFPGGGTSLVLNGKTIIRGVQAIAHVSKPGGAFFDKTIHEGQPGGWDPHARMKDMDTDGVDIAVLYPSWAHCLVAVDDVALATRMARAYNTWLADYCRASPDRLVGVAVVPLQDMHCAVGELRHAVKDLGFKAVMVRPNKRRPGGFLHQPFYDPLWREAQEMGVAIGFHPFPFPDLEGPFSVVDHQVPHNLSLCNIAHLPIDNMVTMMHLIMGGLLDRFPKLQVVFLESYVGWSLMWMDRLDKYYVMGGGNYAALGRTRPSEILARQAYISFEPGERSLPLIAEALGPDRIIWASDYPHFDATFPGIVKELREGIASLPETVQRKILGENAARLYRLPVSVAR